VRRVRKLSDLWAGAKQACTIANGCAVACSKTSRDGYKMKIWSVTKSARTTSMERAHSSQAQFAWSKYRVLVIGRAGTISPLVSPCASPHSLENALQRAAQHGM
jgi:D-alanine-D-alanine ligase-like ATP-grasp enzyme